MPLDLFAVSQPGLEDICAAELAELGLPGTVVPGGVSFSAELAGLARANLGLGVATRVLVRLTLAPRTIHLEVHDNGRGFDPDPRRATGSVGGRGLVGMRERVELLGGTLRIDTSPDIGTRVVVDLPQVTLSEDGDDTAVVVA